MGGTFAGFLTEDGVADRSFIEDEMDGAWVGDFSGLILVVFYGIEVIADDEGMGDFSCGKGGTDAAGGYGGDV